MGKVLLSIHVLAAIVFIGPVTVAVSLFPRYARLALAVDTATAARPVLVHLHRISTVYAVLGVTVPVFGLALASELGVLTDPWLVVSIVLTLLAAAVLAAVVIPAQRRVMARVAADDARAQGGARAPDDDALTWARAAGRLSIPSGVFALLWAVVVVLMVVRPGSTTGV
ncbi:MAG: DUF2269 family protein [Dermatophilaceae bacterium]